MKFQKLYEKYLNLTEDSSSDIKQIQSVLDKFAKGQNVKLKYNVKEQDENSFVLEITMTSGSEKIILEVKNKDGYYKYTSKDKLISSFSKIKKIKELITYLKSIIIDLT